MATPYRLKRSSVASKRPKLTDLDKGELALNFYDGHLFAERETAQTAGVGIGTTVANLTPWKETFGGLAINYDNSVGIGSTNPAAKLDVVGQTELDDLNVSGIATFNNADVDGNFDVDGYTDLDELNVTGIATFTNTVNFDAGVDIDGLTELEQLVVSPGITTTVGGLHVGLGGTILSSHEGRIGVNTTEAGAGFEFEVHGNINIVGDDVEYYQNGARRTAGVGIHSRSNVITGFGATIIDFVGSAVSFVSYNSTGGIATVNINRGQFSRSTTTFTASADQTTFSGSGLSYTPGFIDVFINGVRLTGTDFTATNGTSIVLVQPAFVGDVVDVVAFVDEGFVNAQWSPQDGTPANIFYSTGNVGVGTAIPRQRFDVEGNINIVGIATFTDRVILTGTNSIQIPAGTEAQKDSVATAVTGQIRYNSTNVQFEGFGAGGQWGSLGGVKDVDGDTFITAETSAGSDDDTLSFTTAGTVRAVVNSAGVGIGTTIPRGDLDIGEQFSVKTTTTTVATTTTSAIDTLAIATYRSGRFQVQITQGSNYQSSDLMVIHDGTTPAIIEYASVATSDYLGDFSAAIVGSNLLLQVTMSSATSASIKVVRYGISV